MYLAALRPVTALGNLIADPDQLTDHRLLAENGDAVAHLDGFIDVVRHEDDRLADLLSTHTRCSQFSPDFRIAFSFQFLPGELLDFIL